MHAIRIFTFISLVCFVAAQIKWSEKAPMPLKRSDFTAHTIGDMIIVAGGCDSDQVCPETDFYCYCPSITNKTHAYSPITNSWKSLPDMPRPRQRHAGAVINQKLFLFGGRDINDNIITEVDVFDVSTNRWTTVFDAYTWGEATSDFTATAIGDKIYAIGGYYQDYRSSNRTAVFDTAELFPQWRYDKAPPLQVGRGDACIGTIGDKIIVVGGFSDENFCKPLESVEIYNPANNSWSFASSIEVPRGDAACVVLNEQFHLIGGEAKDNETNCSKFSVVLHDVEVYNQETNKWSFETNLVVNRFRFAAAAWKNNFYVFGGQSGSKDDAYPVLNVVTAFEDLNEVVTTGTSMMSDASVSVVSAFLLIIVMVIIF